MTGLEMATAMVLLCAGKPTPEAHRPADEVTRLKLPAIPAVMEMLRSEPPVADRAFVGENGPKREWIAKLRDDPQSGKPYILRLTKSGDPMSPLAFKAGLVEPGQGSDLVFVSMAEGKCGLSESKPLPEGSLP